MIDWLWVQREESKMIKCLPSAARQVVVRNVYCWYWGKENGSFEFAVFVRNVQWAEHRAHESNFA